MMRQLIIALGLLSLSALAVAAGDPLGAAEKQATN